MRWFKHDTDAYLSEGMDTLIEELGFEGYGRWMRLLEIVAAKMDETDRCHLEYSHKKWREIFRANSAQTRRFLDLCRTSAGIGVIYNENTIRIEIPNLLNKRDNHSKNLQATCKRLASDLQLDIDKNKIRKEKESKEKEIRSLRSLDVCEGEKKTGSVYSGDFEEFWKLYPRKVGKGSSWRAWQRIRVSKPLQIQIQKSLGVWIKSEQWTKSNGEFIPHPSTWLNRHGWEDEISGVKTNPKSEFSEEHRRAAKEAAVKKFGKDAFQTKTANTPHVEPDWFQGGSGSMVGMVVPIKKESP